MAKPNKYLNKVGDNQPQNVCKQVRMANTEGIIKVKCQ